MTPFDRFLARFVEISSDFSIWWLVKGLFLIGLVVYLAFALIVIRQVGLMTKTLDGHFGLLLKLVAWGHFLTAGLVFFLCLTIL